MPVRELNSLSAIDNHLFDGSWNSPIGFLDQFPINTWREQNPEVQSAARDLERLFRDHHRRIVARARAIGSSPASPLGSNIYNPLEGLILLGRLRQEIDPEFRKLDRAAFHVRQHRGITSLGNRGTRALRISLERHARELDTGINEMRERVVEHTRDNEIAELTKLRAGIRAARNGTPPTVFSIPIRNAYQAFLDEQDGLIDERLRNIPSPQDYSVAAGRRFLEGIERNFQTHDQDVRAQHRTAAGNLATPSPPGNPQRDIDTLNFTQGLYGPIFITIQNQRRQLTNTERSLNQIDNQIRRNRRRRLQRAFGFAGRRANSARNYALELGVGAATGVATKMFLAKAAFALAAAVTTGPVGAVIVTGMVLGAATGFTTRLARNLLRGERGQKGWWWKSAAWGAVGGGVGAGIASYFDLGNPFSGLFEKVKSNLPSLPSLGSPDPSKTSFFANPCHHAWNCRPNIVQNITNNITAPVSAPPVAGFSPVQSLYTPAMPPPAAGYWAPGYRVAFAPPLEYYGGYGGPSRAIFGFRFGFGFGGGGGGWHHGLRHFGRH